MLQFNLENKFDWWFLTKLTGIAWESYDWLSKNSMTTKKVAMVLLTKGPFRPCLLTSAAFRLRWQKLQKRQLPGCTCGLQPKTS